MRAVDLPEPASGAAFPFFSATLGWLGVVLTGSVTSSNALFGNLQVVTANRLGMSPIVTAVGLLALIYAYWFPSLVPQS